MYPRYVVIAKIVKSAVFAYAKLNIYDIYHKEAALHIAGKLIQSLKDYV